jgi:D-alanyl-lipoteichoic acid acyltransferase DltB (MBOAT superfamily)
VLFNSVEFLVFFAAFIGLWPWLRTWNTTRWLYLVAASFFFYGWWNWRFLFLLVGNGLVDFVAALLMVRYPDRRRLLLTVSLGANVGALVVFKYLNFFVTNVDTLLDWAGTGWSVPLPNLTLPVGLSFYTFQSMSYTIDVYRGQLTPTRNILHFFASLALFPHLVAGPIIRAADLLPQLTIVRRTSEAQRWEGLRLIVCGYFKKVVIADNLAPVVNAAFGAAVPVPSGAYWWTIALLFAFQIYGDFSGYSDIARGLARWMGYQFPVNFDHPYLSRSFREFWTRWHISLSSWFRDYVYIPLGGSHRGAAAAHRSVWLTMLASGFWHGAAWTFLAWAGLHALYLSIERLTDWPRRLARVPGGTILATLVTLAGVLVAWVFFRAGSLVQAGQIVGLMLNPWAFEAEAVRVHLHWRELLLLGVLSARHLQCHPAWGPVRWPQRPRWPADRVWQPVAVAVVVWACVFLRGPGSAFIYFQF